MSSKDYEVCMRLQQEAVSIPIEIKNTCYVSGVLDSDPKHLASVSTHANNLCADQEQVKRSNNAIEYIPRST